MSDERCDLTELLASQCGCSQHRGGEVIARPETVGLPFEAMYDGFCSACERRFEPGQMISRHAEGDGYIHAERCPR